MVDFVPLAATAERLIRENGRDTTFLKTSQTDADPLKPWEGPAATASGSAATEASIVVRAAIVPVSQELIDGNLIKSDDLTAFVAQNAVDVAGAAAGLTPPVALETFDRMVDSIFGEVKILSIQPLVPATVRVIYTIQLRQL